MSGTHIEKLSRLPDFRVATTVALLFVELKAYQSFPSYDRLYDKRSKILILQRREPSHRTLVKT